MLATSSSEKNRPSGISGGIPSEIMAISVIGGAKKLSAVQIGAAAAFTIDTAAERAMSFEQAFAGGEIGSSHIRLGNVFWLC
jgi:hypothetical protein